MTTAAPPLRQNSSHNGHASYVPHDLNYSASFEDSLIDAVLSSSINSKPGLRILSEDSDEQSTPGQSIRADEINWADLPRIEEDELPLPLDDNRRIFASRIPGVNLTHPGGYLEGGPGLDPEMDTFPDDFFAHQDHPLTTSAQLHKAVDQAVEEAMQQLKERLEARRQAKEKNERIGRELKTLVDQHEMELKIQSKMAENQKKKKEMRDKKRKGLMSGD